MFGRATIRLGIGPHSSFNVLSSNTPRLVFSCTDNFLCAIYRMFQKAESLKHHIFAIISYTVTSLFIAIMFTN